MNKRDGGKDVKRLEEESKLITGNCIVSAGMVAYSGPSLLNIDLQWKNCGKANSHKSYIRNQYENILGVTVVIQHRNIRDT